MNDHAHPPVTVAMSGASGSLYGLDLTARLLAAGRTVNLLLSDAARQVLQQEQGLLWDDPPQRLAPRLWEHFGVDGERLRHYGVDDWRAPVASGSARNGPMVVCPCSMATLAAISHGLANDLIRRAADVTIKEGRTLILVPRETPLSPIHLENMLTLARMGVVIMPAAPGFYHRPQRVDQLAAFMSARILDRLGVPHQLLAPWPEGG